MKSARDHAYGEFCTFELHENINGLRLGHASEPLLIALGLCTYAIKDGCPPLHQSLFAGFAVEQGYLRGTHSSKI